MTFAPLVVAGVAAVCAGGLLAIPRLSFPVGLAVQAAGCLLLAVGGFWSLGDDASAGEPFTSAFEGPGGGGSGSGWRAGSRSGAVARGDGGEAGSALMSGVMIKVALYGLVRVLVEWVGVLPVWFGVLVLGVGALSAVGGVVYALFQHELKRLLALHSIENVGIIVLGLGACLILRSRGADSWAAFALGAALLHTVNHAVFKSLLFLGAGAFERAVGSLELDRLGGLLRRMPWTGGAFLVGAMAIAGLPPLNGFASEWLTLQALLHVTAYGDVWDGLAGAVALAILAATAALALFCFVKVVGLVLLGPPRATRLRAPRRRPLPMRAAVVAPRRRLRRARGRARSALRLARRARALVGRRAHPDRARASGHRLAADGRDRGRARRRWSALLVRCARAGGASRAPAPTWACGQLVEPALAGRAPASPSRCGWCSRPCCARSARSRCGPRAASCRRSPTSGHVPHLIDDHLYGPSRARSRVGAAHARRLQSGSLGTYVAYLVGLVLVAPRRRAAGVDRMSGATAAAAGPCSSSAASRSRRSCRASCSTGRRACRAGAGRRRCSPTASCGGCGARARSTWRERRHRLPARALGRRRKRRRRGARRAGRGRRARPGASATTRSCSSGCSRSRASPSPPRPGTWRTASR